MTGRERTELAFSGKRPDRVPMLPIYDLGYIMRMQGKCVRDFRTASRLDAVGQIVNGYGLFPTDAYFVHGIANNRFQEQFTLQDIDEAGDFHLYKSNETGELIKLNPMGDHFRMDGSPIHMTPSGFESLIQSREDIRRLVPERHIDGYFEEDGYYGPLLRLSRLHPDRHFMFQLSSPFVMALNRCGGYEAAMCMLLEEPELISELMRAELRLELEKLPHGAAAGGRSALLTSYYTGADTISPAVYRELIFPLECELCEAAKEWGLFVALWFLGDLNPLLPFLGEMPFDALYPEQDRKGYGVDYRTLRHALGEERCLFAFTWEEQFIHRDTKGIRETFASQRSAAGSRGAFIAGTTILPEDSDPSSMEDYAEAVEELGVY